MYWKEVAFNLEGISRHEDCMARIKDDGKNSVKFFSDTSGRTKAGSVFPKRMFSLIVAFFKRYLWAVKSVFSKGTC